MNGKWTNGTQTNGKRTNGAHSPARAAAKNTCQTPADALQETSAPWYLTQWGSGAVDTADVAQLVEHLVVAQGVVGSSPVIRPTQTTGRAFAVPAFFCARSCVPGFVWAGRTCRRSGVARAPAYAWAFPGAYSVASPIPQARPYAGRPVWPAPASGPYARGERNWKSAKASGAIGENGSIPESRPVRGAGAVTTPLGGRTGAFS